MLVKRGDQRLQDGLRIGGFMKTGGISICFNVRVGHACEPVQPFAMRIVWGKAAQGGGADNPVAQGFGGGAGERVRGAARPAYYAKLAKVQCVGNGLDIGGRVGDGPAFVAIRSWIAGSRVTDEADTETIEKNPTRQRSVKRSRRSVQQEHRPPNWVAQALNRQMAPVVSLDHLRHGSPPNSSPSRPNLCRTLHVRTRDPVKAASTSYNLTSADEHKRVADLRQLCTLSGTTWGVSVFVTELFPTLRNSPIGAPLTWPDSLPRRY